MWPAGEELEQTFVFMVNTVRQSQVRFRKTSWFGLKCLFLMYTRLRRSHPSKPTSSLYGLCLYTTSPDYTGVEMGQRKLLSQLTHFSEDDGPAAVWLLKYLMTRGCMSDRPKDRNTLRIALMPFAPPWPTLPSAQSWSLPRPDWIYNPFLPVA